MRSPAALIAVILLGPFTWFVSLEASVALSPRACLDGEKLPLYLVCVVALIVVAAAGSILAIQYQMPDRNAAGELDLTATSRHRLSLAGMALSGLCLALILAQLIPNLLMGGCE